MTGLAAYPSNNTRAHSRWVGRAAILASKPHAPDYLRYFALTLCFFASPFLLSLGVSKSMMSIVFLAGPLSGLIVQPLVGVFSDSCKSPLGRRRPFIIGGCVLSSLSIMLLGWAKEIAAIFADEGGAMHQRLSIANAVIAVYVVDFSINVVQAMDRSLLVDTVSPAQQPAANAWASRMFGFGAVFGYWIGGIDLVWVTRGWLGGEQLKVLTIFTSFFLIATHAITCMCVQERVLISRDDGGSGGGPLAALEDIWTTIRTLPRPIQQVFNVQFTSWIGWFPILFFSTTWIAEIYVRTRWGDAQSDLASAPQDVRDAATRAGTRAMLFHSVINLATSILLPPIVAGAAGEETSSRGRDRSYLRGSGGALDRVMRFLPQLPLQWLTLPLLWTFSNALFATLLFATWFATSVTGASIIVAIAGFSWAVTNWAPFALLGELILRIGSTPPMSSPNGSSVMLQRTSADGLYDPERENIMLSPIPEEASDYASSSYTKTPQLGVDRSPSRSPSRSPAPRGLPSGLSNSTLSEPPSASHSPAFTLGDANDDVPYTPTTATSHRSFYFDAPSSLVSSRAESFASSSTGGSRTPTLTASPHDSPRGRARQDSTATEASSASFAFPPNHGPAGLDLLGEPYSASAGGARGPRHSGEFFGADPYAYRPHGEGAGGSSSTVHLPQPGLTGPGSRRGSGSPDEEGPEAEDSQVLQIRHSDSFDLSADERASLESDLDRQREHDGSPAYGIPGTVRPGMGFEAASGGAAGGRRGSNPRIMVGAEGEDTEEWEMEGDQGDVESGLTGGQGGGGDQTGVILGCHNIYLVLPQFLVTGLSSIIFALFAPHHSVIAGHGAVSTPSASTPNTSSNDDGDEYRNARLLVRAAARLGATMMERRAEGQPAGAEGGWDALGLIFRIGGISAICSTYICFRMWRDRQRTAERARAVGRGYRLG
ncbi:hypothetical protein JCM10207_008425 [Rhodosporidiobolus poonsookiae]